MLEWICFCANITSVGENNIPCPVIMKHNFHAGFQIIGPV